MILILDRGSLIADQGSGSRIHDEGSTIRD